MMRQGAVLRSDSLRAWPNGCEVDIRLAWYRSLPLSCITALRLRLDGVEIPPASMQLCVNGECFALDDLAQRSDDWWFIQDAATLRVANCQTVRAGQEVEVSVQLGQRIPYIIVGPQRALTTSVTATKMLVAGAPSGDLT